jgi:hypothetical protein
MQFLLGFLRPALVEFVAKICSLYTTISCLFRNDADFTLRPSDVEELLCVLSTINFGIRAFLLNIIV